MHIYNIHKLYDLFRQRLSVLLMALLKYAVFAYYGGAPVRFNDVDAKFIRSFFPVLKNM